MSNDDFDDLFDSFKERKKKGETKTTTKSMLKSFEELPIWKEVKEASQYTVCSVCRKDIDDEDIVEACKYCNRYFHFRHLREWLKIKGKCPVCRQTQEDQPIKTIKVENEPALVDSQPIATNPTENNEDPIEQPPTNDETEETLAETPVLSEIFISFSSNNVTIAEKIYNTLVDAGFTPWISTKSISVGQDYGLQIIKTIDSCKFFILLITTDSIASRHVKTELERAFSKGAAILPILLDDSKIPLDWEYYLGSSQWLDVGSQRENDWLPQLINAVREKTDSSS